MIRVGEIHGPWLLVRSRVGINMCSVLLYWVNPVFHLFGVEVALISGRFRSACLSFRAKPHKFSH